MFELLSPISGFFDLILTELYGFTNNIGISIILLTLMIKLVTFPLNQKQIQSSKRMQEIQPQMKKIQQQYKDDKQKQNEEVMKFMQENKVNPMAGCLPLLVQMPILISLFHLLRTAALSDQFQIGELNPFLFPAFEFLNLLNPEPFELLQAGSVEYAVLPLLAGLTTFYYQKMMMTDPSQKMLFYMMPAMLLFISFTLPAGVVLYWNVNNVFSIGQHFLLKGKKETEKAKPGTKKVSESNVEEKGKDKVKDTEAKNKGVKDKETENKKPVDKVAGQSNPGGGNPKKKKSKKKGKKRKG